MTAVGDRSTPDAPLPAMTSPVRRMARSGGWFGLAFALGTGASFLVSVVAGRLLGPAGFGEFSYHIWLVRFLGSLGAIGLPVMASRFVAARLGEGHRPSASGIRRLAIRLGMVTAPFAAGAGTLLSLRRGDAALVTTMVAAGAGATVLGLIFEGALSGARQFRDLARIAGVTGAVQVVLAAVAVALGTGWSGFLILQVLAGMPAVVLLGVSLHRSFGSTTPHLSSGERGRALRFAAVMAVVALSTEVVWGRPELWFLDQWWGAQEVGEYGAALRLSTLALVIPSLATRILVPEFSWMAGAERESLRDAFCDVCRLTAFAAMLVCAAGVTLSGELLRASFGDDFGPAAGPARVLLIGSLFGGMAAPVLAGVVASATVRAVGFLSVGLAGLNLALDAVLIGSHGPSGGAAATCLTQAASLLASVTFARSRLGLAFPVSAVARLFVAGLAGTVAGALVRTVVPGPLGTLTAGAVAVATCTALAMSTGAVRRAELAAIGGRFTRRLLAGQARP